MRPPCGRLFLMGSKNRQQTVHGGGGNKNQAGLAVKPGFHLDPALAGKQLKHEKHEIDGSEELHQRNSADPHTFLPSQNVENIQTELLQGHCRCCRIGAAMHIT